MIGLLLFEEIAHGGVANGITVALQGLGCAARVEPEMGAIYTGKVVKVVDFGAFVNFFGAKDGLVHVSQIALERVANPADVLSEGQEVKVKFLGFDDRGKTKLSMKVVDQATGEDITDKINAERAERGEAPLSEDTGGRPKREGGDRGGDRGRRRRD